MKKLFRLVIVGFPNVGKSTLFNRLLGQRKSLVHSLSGMTRDSVQAPYTLGGQKFLLVDTGGLFDLQQGPISLKVREKAWEEAQKASLLLLVLDAKRGLLPAEEEFFRSLKKLGRPVLVVVNKVDSESSELGAGEYFKLARENIFFVSAEHKRNLDELEEGILRVIPPELPERVDEETGRPLKIALVGRMNVGKSSLANRLCGEERFIVSEVPGTTRDSIDTLIRRDGKAYVLIDTAGIRKLSRVSDERESAGIIRAKKNINLADVICLVLDAQEFPTHRDATVAQLALASGKPLLIALNKWDLFPQKELSSEQLKARIFQRLYFCRYAPLLTVSALSGERVAKILDLADRVYQNGLKRVGTSSLNKFIAWVNKNYPPLSKTRKRFRVKYMTQKSVLPPTFILFTNSRVSFFPSYEKFLMNLMRQKFNFWGTPLRFILRSK